jgi:hypothetical protein
MQPTEQAFFTYVRHRLKSIFEQSTVPEYVVGYGSRRALLELLEHCDAPTASRLGANGMTVAAHIHVLSTGLYDMRELLLSEPGTRHDQTNWFKPVTETQWRALVSELKGHYYGLQDWLGYDFELSLIHHETYLLELGLSLIELSAYHHGALESLLGVQQP